MSNITPGNSEFNGVIVNTELSKSALSSALKDTLAPSFKVIHGCIDLSNQAVADGLPILDKISQQQIFLHTGTLVYSAQAYASTSVTSGGSPTIDIGFSLNPSTGTTPAVATSLGSAAAALALTPAEVNAGSVLVPTTAGTEPQAVTLVGANQYLAVDVNVASITAGVIDVILQVIV
jgi:hypothetical protein